MSNQLSFPPVIDSSMRSQFVSCPHSFFRRYIQGLQRPGNSVHLHFGGAFAAGLAAYRDAFYLKGCDTETSLAIGAAEITRFWGNAEFAHENKTLIRCIGALEAYSAHYPPATDHCVPLVHEGTIHTEFSFGLPLGIHHPETDEPLIYSGRFDMLGVLHGNSLCIEDDKTTTQLGQTWGQQWRLRAQFTGYAWGAAQYGHNIQGVVVRGISILRASYGHAEIIEQRPQWMIDKWRYQLNRDIHRMIEAWRYQRHAPTPADSWDQNLDSACSAYGSCAFLDLCSSPDPNRWLGDYEVVHYDPLGGTE